MFTMLASVPTFQISVNNTNFSLNHLSKDLNIPCESRVSFMLYDNPFTISLENFAYHCKLPCWSSLDEPPRAEYQSFLTSLCCGETRGVTQGRIKSIHFPAIQYFKLFNGKCIVGKQDCNTLCAPDLSLICTALTGERC